MEDFEYVQRNLLKVLTEETEKEKQDKTIINQLSKTMAEISKVLAEFGMAPSIVSNIFDIVSMNYTAENSKVDEEIRQLGFQDKRLQALLIFQWMMKMTMKMNL